MKLDLSRTFFSVLLFLSVGAFAQEPAHSVIPSREVGQSGGGGFVSPDTSSPLLNRAKRDVVRALSDKTQEDFDKFSQSFTKSPIDLLDFMKVIASCDED